MKKIIAILFILGVFCAIQSVQASATLNGQVYEINGDSIENINAEAFACSQTNDADSDQTIVSTVDGSFSLTVDGDSEYQIYFSDDLSSVNSKIIYLEDGANINLNFFAELDETMAVVRGKIVDNNGAPLSNESITLYSNEGEDSAITYTINSDSTGKFNFSVPPGNYDLESTPQGAYCGPGVGQENCLGFIDQNVELDPNEILDLGTLDFTPANNHLNLYFFAKNGNDSPELLTLTRGQVQAHSQSGLYSGINNITEYENNISDIPLTSNENWTINASGIAGTSFYHGTITISGDTTFTDIVLQKKYDLESASINNIDETFLANTDKEIILSDGTIINIPAYAIDSEGEVNVLIEPAFDIYGAKLPINGFVYNFTAYNHLGAQVDEFDREIPITMSYDEIGRAHV